MPPADFRLHHGNDLELLAALLAAELAKPAPQASLLDGDTILIPQPAMRRWLQKTLAEAHGIAANLRFLTPGEFVAETLAANTRDARTHGNDVGDAAVLRWRLWPLLVDETMMLEPVFAPLRAVLGQGDRALAAWALAGDLAAAFEKYQAWRRDWLLRWDRGEDRHDWQAELWRRATQGLRHRAARLQAYLARFHGESDEVPAGMPARLFAFACQNVSPDVLRVIASAAQRGPLHFYFLSPAETWWGDLQTVRERLLADPEGFVGEEENPLLAANGAAGRDFLRLLFGDEAVRPSFEQALYVPPDPAQRRGLLHRLQRDLLARKPPPATETGRVPFDPDDRSLQVHACHTRLREVQVLHDRLRDLLETHPHIEARDIAVLTPDLQEYAPYVRAVFGDGEIIPYSLADGSATRQPLAEAFLRLLALPDARFSVNEVLEWLAVPAIAQRFGLDDASLDRLRPWLQEAGVRWGLNAEHRTRFGAPADNAYTWAFAIDRLLLGHASGETAEIHGVAALPPPEGDVLPALDALLTGLRALARWHTRLARRLEAPQWPEQLSLLLDELFAAQPPADEDRRTLDGLRQQIKHLAAQIKAADIDHRLPIEIVRAWFQQALADGDTRQPLLTGGITFARMVPMRLIPYKAICLLGMNDGEFPRRDPAGGLNRLAAQLGTRHRLPGDRSLREDDRLLFIQLFAAASDCFYLSFIGRDARSDESRPPSVVVAELVELANRYLRNEGEAAPGLIMQHPLQPFSPEAFGRSDARRRSFQAQWRAAAGGSEDRVRLPRFSTDATGLAPLPSRVTLEQLQRGLVNPPRTFLQQGLDLRLPRDEDRLPDSEPFDEADGLQRQALRSQVFAALVSQPDIEAESLRRRLLREARIAPGAVGLAQVAEQIARLRPAARQWREWSQGDAQSRVFEIALHGSSLSGRLAPVHAGGLLQFSAGRAHGRNRLPLDIDWLVWSALGETRPVRRLFVGDDTTIDTLAPLPAGTAMTRLGELLLLYRRAIAEALPFMPKTASAYADGLRTPEHEASAWSKALEQWRTRDGRGEGERADVRLALRARDPFDDADGDDARLFRTLASRLFASDGIFARD
ncbi:exodeoxyribonuclease V subunit gamma [Arenimonas sp.]|uniref:exodeoxyribonuclease V subunit gamma n=1 Tax=Arenimonas sp. TaxID=1872635 RepID=UPI0039E45F59